MIIFIVVIPFAVSGVLIFQYMRATFHLLEMVQEHAPAVWQDLGRPERVWVNSNEGMHTIQPLWPWLGWVWKGDTAGLDRRVARALSRTNGLLKSALVAFTVTVLAFLAAFAALP